jgi:A/G-specific adenine glycosylase
VRQKKEPLIRHELDGSFLHKKLLNWYNKNERPLPWRTLWKKHLNPWHVWVSEIMLQQTVIKAVIPVYERFLTRFPSPTELAIASSEDIRLAVRGLGYYRRFDMLHKACITLTEGVQGMPSTHDDWLELPGIGPYTAAAIASITANEPHGVVDGNVERVLCRILDIRTEPNLPHLKKEFKLMMDSLCAKGSPGSINQAVMELGQTVCTPATPDCSRCPITESCTAHQNHSQHLAPAPKSKINFVEINLQLKIVRYQGKILLVQRPPDAKFLKGTWGFLTNIASGPDFVADGTPINLHDIQILKPIGTIKHSITKHKITAEVVAAECMIPSKFTKNRLVDPEQIESSLVSNLDRKAWNLLQKTSVFS